MPRTTVRQAGTEITEQREFKTAGGLWATEVVEGTFSITTGKLPQEIAKALCEDVRRGRVGYVVYSYQTPIGWIRKDSYGRNPEAIVPEIWYSGTTNRHQVQTRRAWNI